MPADPLDLAPWGFADLADLLSMDEWQRVDEVLDAADAFVDVGAKLAYYLSGRVFAGMRLDDEEPPSETRSTHLWRDVRNNRRAGTTDADQFVHRFALRNDERRTMVAVYYESNGRAPFRYPVSPDAGFHPPFRPVTRDDDHPFGRTCPGPRDACVEDLAEYEVVHENQAIRLDRMWIINLGDTSRGGYA